MAYFSFQPILRIVAGSQSILIEEAVGLVADLCFTCRRTSSRFRFLGQVFLQLAVRR